MKELLIDNNSNIYEIFTSFLNNNSKNSKNENKKQPKNIYIPSFYIETHLQTEEVSKEIINNVNIYENQENKTSMKIATVDEFLKINFNKKNAIKKQIDFEIDISNDDNNEINDERNIYIKNDFILGIMNNYTEIKFPLYQLMYITKDFWIKEIVESQ